MGLVPTLLDIYARNQRYKHQKNSHEQEVRDRKKRQQEADQLSQEEARQRQLQQNMPSPFTFQPLKTVNQYFGNQ